MPPLRELPPGHVLLHIGPHKTGSSTIQYALAHLRPELGAYGAAYPPVGAGVDGHDHRAAWEGWAIMGWAPMALPVPPIERWETFAEEVRSLSAEGKRVCVSTESFCQLSSEELIHRIVGDLGGDRVHVVFSVRGLSGLLPSDWQQRVRNGDSRQTFDEYLRDSLAADPMEAPDTRVWRFHGVRWLLDRWLPEVGADRMIALVLEGEDKTFTPRAFETLLGLPEGLLATAPSGSANASLPYDQTELVRRLNATAQDREWPRRNYIRLLHRRVLPGLESGVSAARPERVRVPEWAGALLPDLEDLRARTLEEAGIEVLGDPQHLRESASRAAASAGEPSTRVDSAVAAGAVVELLERTMELARIRKGQAARIAALQAQAGAKAADPFAGISSKAMLREILRRRGLGR